MRPCASPVGNSCKTLDNQRRNHADANEDAPLLNVFLAEQVERADRRHHKRPGDDCAAHVVRILPPGPGIQHQLPEAGQLQRAVGHTLIADRVLHPGIGRNNEVARQPRADEDHERGKPMLHPWLSRFSP